MLIQLELPNSPANGPLGRMAPGLAADSAAVRSELEAPQPEASILGDVGQHQVDEVHADPVEHDGGNDLVDVESMP